MKLPQIKKEKKNVRVKAPGAAKRLSLLVKPYGIQNVDAYETMDSTMDVARDCLVQQPKKVSLVWAATQQQGRGRRGNQWESPVGGTYFTLVIPNAGVYENAPQLSLVAGVAIAECIHGWIDRLPAVKWPNDVLLEGQKVAGVLIERNDDAAFIGVGLNVNTALTELPDNATSLLAETEQPYGVLEITAELCDRLLHWNRIWQQKGFEPVREALLPILAYAGEPVRFNASDGPCEGILVGVDETGLLQIREDSGQVRTFNSGEVSLLRAANKS